MDVKEMMLQTMEIRNTTQIAAWVFMLASLLFSIHKDSLPRAIFFALVALFLCLTSLVILLGALVSAQMNSL